MLQTQQITIEMMFSLQYQLSKQFRSISRYFSTFKFI